MVVFRGTLGLWRNLGLPPSTAADGSTRRGRYKTDAFIDRLKARPVEVLWVDETRQMKDETDL